MPRVVRRYVLCVVATLVVLAGTAARSEPPRTERAKADVAALQAAFPGDELHRLALSLGCGDPPRSIQRLEGEALREALYGKVLNWALAMHTVGDVYFRKDGTYRRLNGEWGKWIRGNDVCISYMKEGECLKAYAFRSILLLGDPQTCAFAGFLGESTTPAP